ncbi:MAG: hypothetical protein ACJ8GN_28635 [Longimicrobiaceae bacterium]
MQRHRATEEERQLAEQRAKREAARELGAFLMDADEYRLGLIEQFGVTALRGQLAENATAYRKECERMQREHVRRTMADALKLAQAHPAPSFRIALYTEERQWRWSGGCTVLGDDPCMNGEYGRPYGTRHKRALAQLAKLGMAEVDYVNPNACQKAEDGT